MSSLIPWAIQVPWNAMPSDAKPGDKLRVRIEHWNDLLFTFPAKGNHEIVNLQLPDKNVFFKFYVEQAPAPVEQAPVEQAPAPVEQAPVEQAPIEQAPVEQAPIEQAPAGQAFAAPATVLKVRRHGTMMTARKSTGAPAPRLQSSVSARDLIHAFHCDNDQCTNNYCLLHKNGLIKRLKSHGATCKKKKKDCKVCQLLARLGPAVPKDDDVQFVKKRTREERDEEGKKNAIVIE